MVREFFRHGSNAVLAAGTVALLAAAAVGKLKLKPAAVATGVGLFYSSEYAAHRFLLHAPPSQNGFVHGLQRRLHYDHHVEPARLDLLFLPVWALFPSLAFYGGAYAAITRSKDTTAGIILGNIVALFFYEWVHYVAHIPYKPKTRYGRYIKKYHLWHHFKNEKLWFGVTNPSFDYLSGTYENVADAARSATTKVLFT